MSYQTADSKKEEFRKYLEKTGVVDALTKVLVNLYEQPERTANPLDFVIRYLGGPSSSDFEALKAENENLKLEIKALKEKIAELEKNEPEKKEETNT